MHSFSWGQLLQQQQIRDTMDSIAHFAQKAGDSAPAHDLDVMDSTLSGFAARPVIHMHGLSLAAHERGAADLEEPVYPVLETLADVNQSRRTVFWTGAATSISWLAHKADIPGIAKIGEMLVFTGEFPSRPPTKRGLGDECVHKKYPRRRARLVDIRSRQIYGIKQCSMSN